MILETRASAGSRAAASTARERRRALVETMQGYAAIRGHPDATVRARPTSRTCSSAVGELLGVRLHNPPLRNGVIVVASAIAPSEFVLLETEKVAGLVTEHGGPTSHSAIFARSLEIPAVSGVPRIAARLRPEDELIVDGWRRGDWGHAAAAPSTA
jgi:phosphoenolpyruvate-protein kinase (PTS system EI component)